MEKTKKKLKMPNSMVLIFIIIVVAALFTYIMPAGEFARVEQAGRMVVDPDSFQFIESTPAGFFDVFRAIPYGMVSSATIVMATLIIGGSLEVIQKTGTINIAISKGIKKIGVKRGDIILVFMFYVFAVLGGFLGFIESSIPFIPIAIPIAVALGYDTITGVAVAIVGAIVGFTAGPTNPFTVAVSQEIAGLPIYSGAGLRIVVFIVMTIVAIHHILGYSKKTRDNPELSYMKDIDTSDIKFDINEFESEEFTAVHGIVLGLLVFSIGLFVYGSYYWSWSFNELSALFILNAVIAGIISKMGPDVIANTFVQGISGMAGGAFIIGLARGIEWVLTQSNIIDTIIYYVSGMLDGLPIVVSALGMLLFIALLNLIIPSGSGKALMIMPIILPIAGIVGISPQASILIYQLGDGITNLCTPVLGVLLLALSFGKVPFNKWLRFIVTLVIKALVIGVFFVLLAIKIGY